MEKRLRTLFSGRVQGVGFRYTAERLSRRFQVKGYVRNLPNGQVELVIEGEEESLNQFLEAISETFQPYLKEVTTRWEEVTGEYQDFGIRF